MPDVQPVSNLLNPNRKINAETNEASSPPPTRRDKGKSVDKGQGGYIDEDEIRARQVESDRIESEQLEESKLRNAQYTVGDEIAEQLQLDEYGMDIDKVCNFLFDETQILFSNTGVWSGRSWY